MTDNTVIVYGPDGPEKHTRANARDLVNGRGYTWHPGVPTTPAGFAPFAAVKAPDGPVPSQKVLDSVGSSGSGASNAAAGAAQAAAAEQQRIAAALAEQQQQAAAAVAAAPQVEVKDFSTPPVDDASDLDDPADAEAEAEPTFEAAAEPEAEAAPENTGGDDNQRGRGRGGRRN